MASLRDSEPLDPRVACDGDPADGRARHANSPVEAVPASVVPKVLYPEVLDTPRGRVYTGDMTTPTQRPPELEPDQLAQAVCVGLCLALAAVLLVLAGVVRTSL
jgi:hypothetical protein